METTKKSCPSLPSNYITIVDLQNRWLKQKQQQDDDHQIKKEKREQTTDNLSNNNTHNCEDVKVKPYSPFHKPNPSKFDKNPNFNTRNGHFQGYKLVKEFRAVGKASNNSSPELSQIDVATPKLESNHFLSNVNEDGYSENTKMSQFRNGNVKCLGKKFVKELNASNSTPESSKINVATAKLESNHIVRNVNEGGDGENEKKNSQFRNRNVNFLGKKLVKEFPVVKKESNSTPEASQINVATAKLESNHTVSIVTEDGDGENENENEKKNSQFRNRNANYFGKKFRVVKKVSSPIPESSQMNVATAKLESNHNFSNNEDEVGENVVKNSRFRKNPNSKIKGQNFRNLKGEKRLKEVESNVAVATVGNDDRKVEDDDERKTKKKKWKKNKKSKKKIEKTIVDDQTVEEKHNHDGEDQTVEKKDIDDEEDDQTVEKKDNDDEGDDQTVKKKDDHDEGENHMVEKEDKDDEGENQAVVKKDNQDEGEDQTVEIERKMKEVNVSEKNERSTAVIEEGRRVYGGYRRVDRREYSKMSWEVRREKQIQDGISTAVIQGQREVYRGYNGVEHRGSFHRRNFRREENVVDQNWGRSTAMIDGWRGVQRCYSGGESRGNRWKARKGELMWVKKNEEHP